MTVKNDQVFHDEGGRTGQSVALGDTGDGNTGVAEDEQGISNRPGDRAEAAGTHDGRSENANTDDGDELADEDKDLAEVLDPRSEPGKPI